MSERDRERQRETKRDRERQRERDRETERETFEAACCHEERAGGGAVECVLRAAQ